MLEDCAEQLDERGKKYLTHIRQSAQRMSQLIDDLLALSRLTRADVNRMRVDLTAVANAVIEQLRLSDKRSVEPVVQPDVWAVGDPTLLRTALENLLGNAWKFTRKRAGARVEFGAQVDQRPIVYFVRDNGAGFDMNYAAKLFGVFQRLHSFEEFEGTGVGLATVQRIVKRHSGRIWAEGAVNRGATFFFTLEGEGERQA